MLDEIAQMRLKEIALDHRFAADTPHSCPPGYTPWLPVTVDDCIAFAVRDIGDNAEILCPECWRNVVA
jgi:hypothetical protein